MAEGWGKLALPGDYGQTHNYWWIPVFIPLFGAVAGILLYDFFIGHVLDARAAMMLTPEPGLAPIPTTDAASGWPARSPPKQRRRRRTRENQAA